MNTRRNLNTAQPLPVVRAIIDREKISQNPILNADSYKFSHWMLMEKDTEYTSAYLEARTGGEFDYSVFFGLQAQLFMDDLLVQITKEMVDEAERVISEHGEPFNRAGWDYIVENHNGYFPIKIYAVREGTCVPEGNVLLRIDSTDPKFNASWAATFVETKLMRVWYPTTIATLSREIKKVIYDALVETGNEAEADMKLVDFGSRGITVKEQSQVGGAAHLVNFQVTDNLPGMATLMDYYTADGQKVTGYSIFATEHSETLLWGKDREFLFYNHIVNDILPKVKIASVVIDTYDTMRALEMFGSLRKAMEKNGTIVFRPDSGDPVEMTEKVILKLDELFGSTVNGKGYKVLNPCARIIQGDGVNIDSIRAILDNFKRLGYSADNIVFGSGGALLQKVNRDTLRFAIKLSHGVVDGEARDVQKVVATDPTKASKKGLLRLMQDTATGAIRTVNQHDEVADTEIDLLEPVYEKGEILRWQSIDEIRELAAL